VAGGAWLGVSSCCRGVDFDLFNTGMREGSACVGVVDEGIDVEEVGVGVDVVGVGVGVVGVVSNVGAVDALWDFV
jgi:hypothetical protein